MQDDTAELNVVESFRALIEREVDRRVRPIENLLKAGVNNQGTPAEEYLDVDALAQRIHTEPKTIRDWVHKKKIPFQKLPTGGIRFAWSEIEAWMKGTRS
jgi:hypothetical protein